MNSMCRYGHLFSDRSKDVSVTTTRKLQPGTYILGRYHFHRICKYRMGVVIHIVFCLVRHLQNKRDEKSYRERHSVKIENVNKEKLKALLIDCEKNGIDPRKRLCDCRCPYSEAKPSSESCCDEKGNDTDDPEKCFAVFGCGSHCSVFNTDVEHVSCCCWNEQDESEPDSCKCLCLLSKCEENEELKTLVEELS